MDYYTLLTIVILGCLVLWLWLSVFKSGARVARKKRRENSRPMPHQESQSTPLAGRVEEDEIQRLIQLAEKLSQQLTTVNNNLLVIGGLLLIALLLMNPGCPLPRS